MREESFPFCGVYGKEERGNEGYCFAGKTIWKWVNGKYFTKEKFQINYNSTQQPAFWDNKTTK